MNASSVVTASAMNIHFDPLLDSLWLYAVLAAALVFAALALSKNMRGTVLRLVCIGVFVLALLNPSLLQEERESAKDVAVVITDLSPSQSYGQRTERTQAAFTYLKRELSGHDDLELRFIDAPESGALANETRLFEKLDEILSDVPLQRRAGVILLSDGQIHDVPQALETTDEYGPVHLLLSGEHNEKDRQLVIKRAPSYGIVGETVKLVFEVRDTDNIRNSGALVTLSANNRQALSMTTPIGQEMTVELPIEHAGQNIFALSVEGVDGELTQANNRAALIVNGVRDRLRVLLVSGRPHAGGRTWRDLLTSDPGVDLVHFTILREPDKLDSTPQRELSLIAFPFRELFEVKLNEFDLIIFDRYSLNHILPNYYFENIAEYVRGGGALMEASGPEFAGMDSIFTTALGDILPGMPDGQILNAVFKPELSDIGQQHPVTRDLAQMRDETGRPAWGPWLRQISVQNTAGDVLMKGIDGKPLLILERLEQGRLAQITSDQIWLWSRGYQGGGPHTELLRRVVHWLMKEPELDERALNVAVSGDQIFLKRQKYGDTSPQIVMTRPDQTQEMMTLQDDGEGVLEVTVQADQLGIYEFEDTQQQKRFAVIGENNPRELQAVLSTEEPTAALVKASGGGVIWLADHAQPDVGYYQGRSRFAGSNWIGLRKNNQYTVTGMENYPLLPEWAWALALLFIAGLTWWHEGRRA